MPSTPAWDARNEIEGYLLEHPSVLRASLLEEEASAGHGHSVAYVIPSPAWAEATKSQTYPASRERRIIQWQTIFDQTYRQHKDNSPDFVGWKSSYTNKAIPDVEMQEWLDTTIERIAALGPKRILEIGCGVGLLVQRLAPKCHTYRGVDLSPLAIARLREFVTTRPDLRHVELALHEATDFDGLAPDSVDMVVLNSVAQYFPSLDYLLKVLEQAVRVVSSGGHIFIGDVRHLGLLPVFHCSVQLARASPEANVRWLKRKVALAVEQETELVIDPQFFLALSQSLSRVAGVEILLKRGHANNELTRYRYDVVLHVGETTLMQPQQEPEWQAGNDPMADLVARFEKHPLPAVRIVNVPNRRVALDLALEQLLDSAHERVLVKELREEMKDHKRTGIDPEAIWQLSDSQVYGVRVGWSAGSRDGSFDVTLVDHEHWSGPLPLQRFSTNSLGQVSTRLATDPIAVTAMNKLGLDLGTMLRGRFTESLLPTAVVVVTTMPER